MSWRMIKFGERSRSAQSREFEEAMSMAKEGLERVCELAEEMADEYGERRSGYGRRGDMWDEEMAYGERRRRDSRGRYI